MDNIIKRLSIWAIVVAGILLVPYIGKAPWTLSDFVFAGTVLFGSATMYELVTKDMKNKNQKYLVGLAVCTIIFLIWAWAVA